MSVFGADPAEDPEDRLHEERRLHEVALQQVRQVVQVPDVVALELEAGPERAEPAEDVLHVLERVPEDEVPTVLEEGRLPVVQEGVVAGEHGEQPEVHRAHVERGQLGLGRDGAGDPLFEGHVLAAAGGDVDDRVAARRDLRQELHEDLRVGRRPAVTRIARVEVQDRGARLRRLDRRIGDLTRGDRQVRRHRRCVDRAGDRAADDDLRSRRCHGQRGSCWSVARAFTIAPATSDVGASGRSSRIDADSVSIGL